MPGINLGQPDTNDYVLGRGIIYLGKLDANSKPKEWRDVGNATAFTLTVEREKLEHFSSRAGLKVLDKEVTLQQSVSLSFTLDEINNQNMALFLSGDYTNTTQTGATYNPTAASTDFNLTVTTLGRWYDLYASANMTAYPPASTTPIRAYAIDSSQTIALRKISSGAVLANTEYIVDYEMGRVFIKNNAVTQAYFGAFVAGSIEELGTPLNVQFQFTTLTRKVQTVAGLTKTIVNTALKFVSDNAADPSTGSGSSLAPKKAEFEFHSVNIGAEGDFGLISDEFTGMGFTGKAQAMEAAFPSSPTVTVTVIEP